ncbi:MAG TPA: chemotaxis protein CheB [Acetivibrio clariflavus]|nr:chemotaxis protein CheB [Acetivibrio clariflavus]
MGSDGKNGVMMLKQKCNCYCITQSENTCVVYGMPKSVYQSGLSDEVIDIGSISKRIQGIATGKGILPL